MNIFAILITALFVLGMLYIIVVVIAGAFKEDLFNDTSKEPNNRVIIQVNIKRND
ncbi:MAG: hypothetical protein ACRCZB_09420 [Bacteroidales bacterium]